MIYAGGGVIAADAAGDVAALAHKAGIPVATTMMGIGSIDERDPFALGMSGMYGTPAANRALAEADVILALGVRFNDRTTGFSPGLSRKAKIVHVDCDASSINKNVAVHLGIVADVKDLLATVDSRICPAEHKAWTELLAAERDAHAARSSKPCATVLPDDVIVTTDVGEHQLWAVRNVPHVYPRHFLSSGGMGAMGFGIPAAIGAAIARPGHPVVALVGDGGAQMTGEELIVAVEHGLDVTFVVLVNRSLGLVRRMQDEEFGGRRFATDLVSPDFVRLARAYGLRGVRVEGIGNLPAALAKSLKSKGPTLVEVIL